MNPTEISPVILELLASLIVPGFPSQDMAMVPELYKETLSDIQELAVATCMEAESGDTRDKAAVAAAILRRAGSRSLSISEVLSQPGQFPWYGNKKLHINLERYKKHPKAKRAWEDCAFAAISAVVHQAYPEFPALLTDPCSSSSPEFFDRKKGKPASFKQKLVCETSQQEFFASPDKRP